MKKTVENDLEQLIRNSAEQIRLHPSPKVWKGINAKLHRRKRIYAAAGLLLLLLGLSVAVYIPLTGSKQQLATIQSPDNIAKNITRPDNGFTPPANTVPGIKSSFNPVEAGSVQPGALLNNEARNPTAGTNPVLTNDVPVPVNETVIMPAEATENSNEQSPGTANTAVPFSENRGTTIRNDLGATNDPVENMNAEENKKPAATSFTDVRNDQAYNMNAEQLTANNNIKKDETKKPPQLPANEIADGSIIKLTLPQQRRFTTEFYVSPSISYRKLADSRDPNDPNATSKEDFDKAVFHKPSLGLEAGVSVHYRIYDRFRAKAGVQLNYNRFNMKATRAPQPEIATIALYGNNRDLYNTSTLRTNGDNNRGLPEWLKNKNVQVSLPIGFEVALTPSSKGNTTLNIGATAQPSYLLGDKNYLLSTDLKNYTTEPTLVRRFNMNFGFETFFAFESKGMRWHIGPQIRYQLFSTYNKIYPIRENLIDYSFKISISKPF